MKNGVDIVQIKRVENMNNLDTFIKRNFTKAEQEYIYSKNKIHQTIAGLYAAKEAVLKAIGIGICKGLNLNDVEITHNKNGEPNIQINAKVNYYLNLVNCSDATISISHDGDYAVAFCIIY